MSAWRPLSTIIAALSALSLLGSCAGAGRPADAASGAAPEQQLAAAGNPFGRPSELLRQASTGPSDSDRFQDAGNKAAGLPANKVNADPEGDLDFQPQYLPPSGEVIANAAFATYQFNNMGSYSGTAQVSIGWHDPAPAAADTYFGVANFAADAWDWFQPDANWVAGFGPYEEHVSLDGRMLVIVLLLGGTQSRLDWVLIGDSSLPSGVQLLSDLNADPALNLAPLTVNFNALSPVYGAAIESYDFDIDGNAGFEITGNTSGMASFTYDTPGLYSVFVTVHTSDGNFAQDGLTFTVVDPANTPPLPGIDVDLAVGDAPLKASFSGAASSDDGFITDYEWDFDADGIYDLKSGSATASYIFGRSGLTLVELRVTDNDFATATATIPIEIFSGWHIAVVDPVHPNVKYLTACASGSGASAIACVAWQDYVSGDLFFSSAQDSVGTTWNFASQPVDNGPDVGHGLSMISESQGNLPLLAYGLRSGNQYTQYTVKAQNQTGTMWDAPVLVDASANAGHNTSLGKIGTTPLLFSVDGTIQGMGSLKMYRALNDAGSSWGLSQTVAPVPEFGFFGGLSCGGASGFPIVAFSSSVNGGVFSFGAYTAGDVGGTFWDAPDSFSGYFSQGTALVIADGKPAIASGDSTQEGALHYIRADDVEGRNWTGAVQELAPANLGGWPSMVLFQGRPVIAYKSFSSGDLWLIQAQDNAGSAWYEPYRIDSLASCSDRIGLVALDSTLVICYHDNTSDEIRAAYFN